MRASKDCSDFLKEVFPLKLKAHRKPGGIWTIGYGCEFNYITGKPVQRGDKIKRNQADAFLVMKIAVIEDMVSENLKGVKKRQGQFDTICCIAYTCGRGEYLTSGVKEWLEMDEDGRALQALLKLGKRKAEDKQKLKDLYRKKDK